MNVFLFTLVNKTTPADFGVYKKINGEAQAFKNAGCCVFLGYILDNKEYIIENKCTNEMISVSIDSLKRYRRMGVIYNFILSFMSQTSIDIVYMRLGVCSLQTVAFYSKIKKLCSKLILEIPTWPLKQRRASIKSEFKSKHYISALHDIYNITINSLGVPFFQHYIDRIVIIGLEIPKIWNIPTITINNGIDTDSIPMKKNMPKYNETLNLICVANLSVWHGIDKVIKGIATYNKKCEGTKVCLNIVGTGSDASRLKELVEKLDLTDCVLFKGFKQGADLDKEFDDADLAISVLGADKGHLIISDSLKSKEYCARGIPFVTGSMETKYTDLPFVYQIEEGEKELCIADVLSFYESIKTIPDLNYKIRQYSYDNCDWKITFDNVIRFCKNEN